MEPHSLGLVFFFGLVSDPLGHSSFATYTSGVKLGGGDSITSIGDFLILWHWGVTFKEQISQKTKQHICVLLILQSSFITAF